MPEAPVEPPLPPQPEPPAEPEPVRSRWVVCEGVRVHHVEHPGPDDGPVYVLVHGLGGSLVNWDWLAPLLAEHGRVLALDLGGFGETAVPPSRAGLSGNQKVLAAFLRSVTDRPVVLVGSSMGGMLSARLAVAEPDLVDGLVLIDPALPSGPSNLPEPLVAAVFSTYLVTPLGRRLINARAGRAPAEALARESLALVTGDHRRVPPWLLARHVTLAQQRVDRPESTDAFLVAARSVLAGTMSGPRYDRLLDAVRRPVLLVHGTRDRLVRVSAARRAARRRPRWTYAEGQGLGHCPMMEDAPWVRDQILAWQVSRRIDATG